MSKRLQNKNIKILTNAKITQFSDKVYYEKDGKSGSFEPFDSVIIATGLISESEVVKRVKESGVEFSVIGDAKEVADVYKATTEGYKKALEV
jgi:NADH dehydrogenase FAD-containing subunit